MPEKTVVQELINLLENSNAIDKAFWIEKERHQIIDAYWAGIFGWQGAELYYDSKFTQKEIELEISIEK